MPQPGTPEGRRVVELLWAPAQQPPVRGPKPRTSLADVVAAGVAIADAEGLAALSMRKVAKPSRDRRNVALHLRARPLRAGRADDRSRLRRARHPRPRAAVAAAGRTMGSRNLAHLCRAPVAAGLQHGAGFRSARMSSMFPRRLYAALLTAGFAGAENVAISNLIQWQLLGAARSMISDADEARHTGVSAEAYWDSRASFWVTYFDWDRYPTMAAIWEAGGFDDPAGWDFERMLHRLLTGIEQLAVVSQEPETRAAPTARRDR